MVCENAADFTRNNLLEGVQSGRLHRGILQRNAMNICNYLMHSNAMTRFLEMSTDEIKELSGKIEKGKLLFENTELSMDNVLVFDCKEDGNYVLGADIYCEGTHLSQNTVIVYVNEEYLTSFTVVGSNGSVSKNEKRITLKKGLNRITVKHHAKAVSIEKISIFEEL
jgi:beta-glucosidase